MAERVLTPDETNRSESPSPWNGHEFSRWLEELAAKGTLAPCRALLLSAELEEEAMALRRHGFHTIVVDRDKGALSELKAHARARGADVDVIACDVFAAPPSFFGPVELIVDRTFFHSLEPIRRAAWAYLAGRLLPPGGHVAALFRVGRMPGGPPYAVGLQDLKKLLRRQFTTLQLEETGSVPPGSDHAYRGLFRRL